MSFILEWFLKFMLYGALLFLVFHWTTGGQDVIIDSERAELSYCSPYDTSCE